MTSLTQADITQMRDQVFFEGPERRRRLSRLPVSAGHRKWFQLGD